MSVSAKPFLTVLAVISLSSSMSWCEDKPADNKNLTPVILDGKPAFRDANGNFVADPDAAAPPKTDAQPAPAKSDAAEAAPAVSADQEVRIRSAIRRLNTGGWREAQNELIDSGKAAVPYLIDAMGEGTGEAYNLGAHTKADSGHATRHRTLGEVAAEVLTEIVKNHSSYKGEVPALDQKVWQAWWATNANSITFAK